MSKGFDLRLPDGTPLGEAASAFQKAIRRGHEEVAYWWAKEISAAGFYGYVWKRMAAIASEDVGNADPMAAVLVSALWSSWKLGDLKDGDVTRDLLAQAVLYLCRARKTREADELVNLIVELEGRGWKPAVPVYALDVHTERGRQRARRLGITRDDPRYLDSWWQDGVRGANMVGQSRFHARLAAYGGDPVNDWGDEHTHETANHDCSECGSIGDVNCADEACAERDLLGEEFDRKLCLGCAVPCVGLCGVYWCHAHAPALNLCSACCAASG